MTGPAREVWSPASGARWLAPATILAAGLLAYSNSFDVPFQFDDIQAIVQNPTVHSLQAFFSAPAAHPRPLGYLSFALNGSIGGLAVLGFHVGNFAIHALTAVAVYRLTLAAARGVRPSIAALEGRERVAALVAGLVFVLHPVQTQAVTYIVQRFASLAALLYVASVLAYATFLTAQGTPRRSALYVGSLLLGALALLTKQNAATLPAAVALWDLAFSRGNPRERLLRLAPFFAMTALVVLIVLKPMAAVAGYDHDFQLAVGAAAGTGRAAYWLTQVPALLTYLRLVALPVDQNLDYDFPTYASFGSAPLLASLAGLVAILGVPAFLAWRSRSRSGIARIYLFACAWLLVTLSVESVIPMADAIMEHRLYLPMAGIALLGGVAFVLPASPRGRRLAILAAIAWLAALGVATHARNEVWRDPMTLWSDTHAKSPGKARPAVWLAQQYTNRGDHASAIRILEAAVAAPRTIPEAHTNLAASYASTGRPAKAAEHYRKTLAALPPELEGARAALGGAIANLDAVVRACDPLASELGGGPGDVDVRRRLAACRYGSGDLEGAASEWSAVLDAEGDAISAFNLADALDRMQERQRAASAFRRFLGLAGDRFPYQRHLAQTWLATHPAISTPAPAGPAR